MIIYFTRSDGHYLEFCEYFLCVSANDANSLAVSSQRVKVIPLK